MVKYLVDVKDCFEQNLLSRITPSIGLAKKSIKQARSFLKDAEDLIKMKKDRIAVIALYNAFFHAARALLFRDGVKERSHFCVARYLEEYYVNRELIDIKFLNYLDSLRDLRHDVQYSVEEVEIEEDLKEVHTVCLSFIEAVERLVK